MEALGVDKNAFKKPEYKRTKGSLSHVVIFRNAAPRPVLLAKFAGDWEIFATEWDALMTGKTERELYAALTE